MPKNYHNRSEEDQIYKDFLKSTYVHVFLFLLIFLISLFGNYRFNSVKQIKTNLQIFSKQQSTANHKNITDIPIVHANLIDQKMVQEAIQRQNAEIKNQFIRQQNLKQQEQQLAQLKKTAEQEVLKLKKETAKIKKAEEKNKFDQEQLKKQHQDLQKTAESLKKQAKNLTLEQEKLNKIKSKQMVEKKKSQETTITQEIIKDSKNFKDLGSSSSNNTQREDKIIIAGDHNGNIDSHLALYQAKWKSNIISNRKKFTFFPTNIICAIKIKLQSNGKLALVKIDQSSGNLTYDSFSEQAIYKSEPFEMPDDPAINREFTEMEHVFEFKDSEFTE